MMLKNTLFVSRLKLITLKLTFLGEADQEGLVIAGNPAYTRRTSGSWTLKQQQALRRDAVGLAIVQSVAASPQPQ